MLLRVQGEDELGCGRQEELRHDWKSSSDHQEGV